MSEHGGYHGKMKTLETMEEVSLFLSINCSFQETTMKQAEQEEFSHPTPLASFLLTQAEMSLAFSLGVLFLPIRALWPRIAAGEGTWWV